MFEPTLLLFLFTCCLAMLLPPKKKDRAAKQIPSHELTRGKR